LTISSSRILEQPLQKGGGGTHNLSNQLYDQLLDTVSAKTLVMSWVNLLLADRFLHQQDTREVPQQSLGQMIPAAKT
jgi:hypothetical protein